MTSPGQATGRPSPTRLPGLLLAVLGLLLLAAATLPANSATRILSWPWWAGWRLLLAIPPALLLLRIVGSPGRPLAVPPVAGWAALALAAVHLLSAMINDEGNRSLLAAGSLSAALCLALLLGDWSARSSANRQCTLRATALAGTIVAIVSLGLWLAGEVLPTLARIKAMNSAAGYEAVRLSPHALRNLAPLGHPNFTAGVGLLVLPATLALVFRPSRFTVRAAWCLALVLQAAMLISSGSRGMVLGIGVGAAFALTAFARHRGWSARRFGAAAAGALVLLAVLVLALPRTRAAAMLALQGKGFGAGDEQRAAMLKVGWAMGADHPWLGQGPGMVPLKYPLYRHTVDGGSDTVLQLHSTPLQLWADTGLAGVAAAAVLFFASLALMWRQTADRDVPDIAGLAAGAALAGYGAYALTDYQLDVPLIAALVAAQLALLWRVRGDRPVRFLPSAGALVAAGILATAVFATARDWPARRLFAEAMTRLETTGDLAEFEEAIEPIVDLAPNPADYLGAAAAVHLRFLYAGDDPGTREQHAASARLYLDRVLEYNPESEFARTNLGWLTLADAPHEAIIHFRRAIRLAPARSDLFIGLGLAHLRLGEIDAAIDAFAIELLRRPAALTSPFWQAETLAPHLAAAVRRACEIAPRLGPEEAMTRTTRLLLWWLGEAPLPMPVAPSTDTPTQNTPGLAVLARAIATPETRRQLLARYLFIRTGRQPDAADLDTLETLLDELRNDWRAWLRHPAGHRPPFLRLFQRERTAHPMLAGNLDLPVPVDANLAEENDLARLFFGALFPPKGLPSDPAVLHYVAERGL